MDGLFNISVAFFLISVIIGLSYAIKCVDEKIGVMICQIYTTMFIGMLIFR